MVSDSDLTAAVLIALVLLVVALCVWPGVLRLRSLDLAGYWASPTGDLYEIRATGARAFDVRASRSGPGLGRPGAPGPVVPGRVTGVRGVSVPSGRPSGAPLAGSVEVGGRRISWASGDVWTRQGVGR